MNKTQADSRAVQRAVARETEQPDPAGWAVICFSPTRTNRGKEIVQRRLWACATYRASEVRFHLEQSRRLARGGDFFLAIVRGDTSTISKSVGDRDLVVQWRMNRKGLNCGVDPFSGAHYMDRESGERRTWQDEARAEDRGRRRAERHGI